MQTVSNKCCVKHSMAFESHWGILGWFVDETKLSSWILIHPFYLFLLLFLLCCRWGFVDARRRKLVAANRRDRGCLSRQCAATGSVGRGSLPRPESLVASVCHDEV